jgi:riboflavin biosynthesis pyrimidine reductase
MRRKSIGGATLPLASFAGALQRIWPSTAEVTPDDLIGDAGHVPDDRPWVSAIMVSSVDGRATLGGTSRALGGPQDLQMLLALRRRADALLVGPGTVRAEGYGPLPCPAVLVSRSFRLPWEAGLFAAPGQKVLVYSRAAGAIPDVAADVETVAIDALPDVLADLRGRGVERLLCEGGPSVNRALLDAGLLDELFLTLTPVVSGDEGPSIVGAGAPVGLELRSVATADGDLYLRYSV